MSSYPELSICGVTRYDSTFHFYSRIQAMLRVGWRVLDVGCGRGPEVTSRYEHRTLRTLQRDGLHVIGIDPEPVENKYVDEFRRIESPPHWPVGAESVDMIVCDYVLEHVEDVAAFWRQAYGALKPGGLLALRTPNKWCLPCAAARMIPARYHGRVMAKVKPMREAADTFPTFYRCNTMRQLKRSLRQHGLHGAVYRWEEEPTYLEWSPTLFRIGSYAYRWLPPWLQSTLIVFAERPGRRLQTDAQLASRLRQLNEQRKRYDAIQALENKNVST